MSGRPTVPGPEAVGDWGAGAFLAPEVPPATVMAAPAVRQPLGVPLLCSRPDHRGCRGAVVTVEDELGQSVELRGGRSAAAAESCASSDSPATLVRMSGFRESNCCRVNAVPTGHC